MSAVSEWEFAKIKYTKPDDTTNLIKAANKAILELQLTSNFAIMTDPPHKTETKGEPVHNPTCTSCPWWFESPKEELPEEWQNSPSNIGQCRISPPIFLNNNAASVGYWPSIDGNLGWCREHPERKRLYG